MVDGETLVDKTWMLIVVTLMCFLMWISFTMTTILITGCGVQIS